MIRSLWGSFVRWRWRRQIAYLQLMIDYYSVYNEDVERDGKSADWHAGRRVGLKVALYHLFGVEPVNWD